MAGILMQLPLNIGRAIEEMLKEYGREFERKFGIPINIDNRHICASDDAGERACEPAGQVGEASMPDMLIGHPNYFNQFPEGALQAYFRPVPSRFPLRPELAEAGFADPGGYFHPFVITPFAVFYNPKISREETLPRRWADLLDNCWMKKIALPDKQHMGPQTIRAYMKACYPEKSSAYDRNMVHLGTPINVVNAVDEGLYPLGITNISFARISRNKSIRIQWLQEGLLCMPLVMVWHKKAGDRMLELGDFLLSGSVQEYLALQTFMPVSVDAAIPQLLTGEHSSLVWNGWDNFMKAIRA